MANKSKNAELRLSFSKCLINNPSKRRTEKKEEEKDKKNCRSKGKRDYRNENKA